MRALTWRDVDLKRQVLSVRAGLTKGKLVTPKSGHGRVVPMPKRLLELLPNPGRPNMPVAYNVQGEPWSEYGLIQTFERARDRLGLNPKWTPYSLRRFFIIELFRRAGNARAIQRLVGHASLNTTQIYADLSGDDLAEVVQLLD